VKHSSGPYCARSGVKENKSLRWKAQPLCRELGFAGDYPPFRPEESETIVNLKSRWSKIEKEYDYDTLRAQLQLRTRAA